MAFKGFKTIELLTVGNMKTNLYMQTDKRYSETGSNPYHININNTAKDYSLNDNTNSLNSLADIMIDTIIVEDSQIAS